MLLSLAIWVPIAAGLLVLAAGGDARAPLQRWLALAGAVLGCLVTIPLYLQFQAANPGMQFVELSPWIERFAINYHLGVDGISVLFILLNSFITVLVVIAAWTVIESRVGQYYAAFLILSGLLNGVFAALDGVLFYVFFEATLIPMFIIIGVWGGPNRVYAAVKFFLYTLFGSLLMLVALLYLYGKSGSFSILAWHQLPLSLPEQKWLFFGLLFAFAVKVPMWPVHTWLPDAHTEAPTGGSVVLAAILLKLGAYGFIRFTLPILPDAARSLAWLMIAASLIAVVYIGLVALVQTDMKKLIAYSSISHMGFVTLGFFVFNSYGVEGALVQAISHGFVSAAMFFCVGVLYDRMHTRNIADYGGVVNTMPKFAALMMLFAMANSGLPATSGFVGEFMVIMGAMQASFWLAFLAATTLVFGAAYTLWMYKRVIFGAVANQHVSSLQDLNPRELIVLGALALAVLFMGIYPLPFTEVMHASVNELLRHVALSKMNWELIFNHLPALPEMVLLAGACAVMLVDVYSKDQRRTATYVAAQCVLLACLLSTAFVLYGSPPAGTQRYVLFEGLFVADLMGHVLKLVCYGAVSAALVYSRQYLLDRGLMRGEFVSLLLFSLLGMMVMISANSFLTVYLGLELMSLCLYAMVALDRDSPLATEAAMKYFILGALASGLMLYGMSMLYGATGTLAINEVAGRLAVLSSDADRQLQAFGLVFMVAGIAFKIGVVPFHMWIPDVYHGAPTPVTLVLGSGPKVAAFAMAMRLLVNGMLPLAQDWQPMLALLALLSMALGNITAIAQSNIKRMLAYSAIANMGFMLLGLLSGVVGGNTLNAESAYGSALLYAIVYAVMSVGAFGMVLFLSRAGFDCEKLDDFRGLNRRSPWFAFLMLLLMLSLAGLPPTLGFYAKLAVLQSAVSAGQVWLAVAAVVFSLIGAFYYLRIVKLMYFDEPSETAPLGGGLGVRVLLSVNGLALLIFGIVPQPLVGLSLEAIKALQL